MAVHLRKRICGRAHLPERVPLLLGGFLEPGRKVFRWRRPRVPHANLFGRLGLQQVEQQPNAVQGRREAQEALQRKDGRGHAWKRVLGVVAAPAKPYTGVHVEVSLKLLLLSRCDAVYVRVHELYLHVQLLRRLSVRSMVVISGPKLPLSLLQGFS